MTREQISALLPEGTEGTVVTALLDALHAEIKPYKDAAKQHADDLAAKVAELGEISKRAATAEEKVKAFDELQARYDADIKAANDRAAAIEFDSLLDGALREKGAKNLKAAKALLDMETLRSSKNQKEDVYAAVAAIASAEDSAFIFGAHETGKTSVGVPSGTPTQPADGVESAFKLLNPDITY